MNTSGPGSLTATGRHPAETDARHIVDVLIQERAPGLLGRRFLGAAGRRLLYPLLGYREAVRIADEVAVRDGLAAMRFVSRELALQVDVQDDVHVPRRGAALLVSNHPTGIADGIVVHDAITPLREDLMIFANRDAIRISAGFADLMIPVEWMEGRRTRARTRETLQITQQAFRDERLVVMFPSGRLAYRDDGRLRERAWLPTAVSLARRHGVPIVPMHIEGRNSALFYLFSRLSDQLRDITLFHEVLNKRGTRYGVRFAAPIPAAQLDGDAEALTARLQAHVESRFTVPFLP
ncbi:MAG TPA: 1-acyl-sn-glycerol-3-phosphate acyltransferase [Pseudomonadales bacterium]|nr:1-acyl-sn-glycerol-3-phosphate acyltransferase [Pseudomonadales bacterium]